jgi:hypothetical protein
MNCPTCGTSEVRPSEHSHWSDGLQRIMGRLPYRCRTCRLRFYSSKPLNPLSEKKKDRRATHDEIKRSRRRLWRVIIAVAIFAGMFVIFLMILNFLTSDKGPAKDFGVIPPASISYFS